MPILIGTDQNITAFTNYIKLAFVAVLRYAFSSDLVPDRYKYTTEERTTKIKIYRSHPKQIEMWPCIILRCGSSREDISALGSEEALEDITDASGIPTGVSYMGSLNLPVDIEVQGKSTKEREQITDLAIFFLRFLFRQKIQEKGIAFTRINIHGESEDEIDKEIIYKNEITIDCYYEFTHDYENIININEIIRNFDIEDDMEVIAGSE